MKKKIIIFLMLIPLAGIAQWNYINQGNTGNYRVIKFNNESEGWAMGSSCFIQKTTDGGNTWIQVPCNGNVNIEDFQFINDSVAYCAGWYDPIDDFSEILKYDYINESWNVICTLDSLNIRALHFLDPLTGFIVSAKGIQKTDDGGISWSTVWDAPFVGYYRAYLRDIIFVNDSVGFACGRLRINDWDLDLRRVVLKSTDKGENWFPSYIDSTNNSHTIYRLNYVKDNSIYIYASTSSPYFLKTSDYGDSWEIIGSSIQKEYKPIYFVSTDTGYAAATALATFGGKVTFEIWRTTDGALTWNLQFVDSAYTRAASSISFVNDTIGYVAGTQTMLKTENGGITSGIHLNERINNMEVNVYPNPTNHYVNIEVSNTDAKLINLEVMNLDGKVINRMQYSNNKNYFKRIDLSEYSRGIYLLHIRTNKTHKVVKFVIY